RPAEQLYRTDRDEQPYKNDWLNSHPRGSNQFYTSCCRKTFEEIFREGLVISGCVPGQRIPDRSLFR
ncbi:MAG: hypothetical protein Q4D40_03500, partial [Eubacteriales bacterium]|nr:hypothetical protein [Eubacteriales bacterium]